MIQLCSKMSTQNRFHIRSNNLLVQIVPMYDSNFFLLSPWILYSSSKPNNLRQALNLSFPLFLSSCAVLTPDFYLSQFYYNCLFAYNFSILLFLPIFLFRKSLSSEVSNNLLAHIHVLFSKSFVETSK